MIFKVEHLGPVERAEIDLGKDLILLTGPNGTGKTYVAWAAYGLLEALWYPRSRFHLKESLLNEILLPYVDALLESGESDIELEPIMRQHGHRFFAEAAREYSRHIADDFATEKRLFETTILDFDVKTSIARLAEQSPAQLNQDSGAMIGSTSKAKIGEREVSIATHKPAGSTRVLFAFQKGKRIKGAHSFPTTGNYSKASIPLGEITPKERMAVREAVLTQLGKWIEDALRYFRVYIFPTERIATTIFWRELSLNRTELVDEALSMRDRSEEKVVDHMRSRAQRYPWPIRSSLLMAGNLEGWRDELSEFADLAEYLEEHLLRGKVRLSPYGQLEFVPAQRPDVVLGVHITASMVKSLSLLVFYLHHMAKAGDLVIIDEPELNLHPDNQRLIARVLARAVNRGLKIMTSTHSDYLIRELNNLIMLGQDTDRIRALRTKLGYEDAEVLKPSQLGVYLFRNNTAEVVPVDETGFAIETIDAEVNRLNAVSQELYATLLDQEP
jgi:hypothetical protein